VWFALVPALAMLVTTGASLCLMLRTFAAPATRKITLLVADIVIIAITLYLLVAGARAAVGHFRTRKG